jgi:hypothetical protein
MNDEKIIVPLDVPDLDSAILLFPIRKLFQLKACQR